MAVFRIDKTKDYTVMANHHLRNKALSLKAKGLLSLMLSLPDDWDYTTKGLARICKDGVDSICATVKELEQAGYVKRHRLRDSQGRLTTVEYVIHEKPVPPEEPEEPEEPEDSPKRDFPVLDNPVLEKPVLGFPEQGKPEQGKPEQENPDQLNIQESKTKKSNTDLSNTHSFSLDAPEPAAPEGTDGQTDVNAVREQIEYDVMVQRYSRVAVSPSMKALGVKNRCRVKEIPSNIKYITAPPRMQLYIDCAAEIHGVFLKYFAPEDIFTYSIDESFMDVTPYLKMYGMTTRQLAQKVIQDVKETVGTISTCGIGSNLFLAKVALDIQAKHAPDFIAELDEEKFQATLWDHQPITDFWRIAGGTAQRLRNHGLTTLRDITLCNEDFLYDWFGIDAELLIDHAWGREPTTIADIKAYRSKSKSLSSGQVLMRDYKYREAEIIAKEMVAELCLDMAAKKLATESVSLYIGYSYTQGVPGTGGTAKLAVETNSAAIIIPAVAALYKRIVNPSYVIRRVTLCCNNVVEDQGVLQLNMFEDTTKQIRNRALQDALLGIRAKYGKNAILRGISYEEASTARERNNQIGGHRSGTENSQGTHAQKQTS